VFLIYTITFYFQNNRRDGASTGGAISGYNDGGAKTAHYGMHYVDGGSGVHSSVYVYVYILYASTFMCTEFTYRERERENV